VGGIIHSVARWSGGVGAELASLALMFGCVIAVGYVGVKAWEFTGKKWVGWLAGAAAAIILLLLFSPALDALQRVSCRTSDDYRACMDGDDGG
jgi:hypothetical protein